MIRHMMIAVPLLGLSACASIVGSNSQSIAIQTNPPMQATCILQNGRGRWNAASGSALVKRSQTRLNIACDSPTHSGQLSERATAEPLTFGNLIIGWIGGAMIDAATGSMFAYDEQLTIPMQPKQASAMQQYYNDQTQSITLQPADPTAAIATQPAQNYVAPQRINPAPVPLPPSQF